MVVAAIFFLLATLPPQPVRVTATIDPDVQRRTVPGAYHIHSTRSDGAADKDTIAAAAAHAGLAFIILTDHGDGTRRPDPPEYRHGVLCLDGVEISTSGGHYVALDMAASPYPLGGEPTAVVEDVRRLGGFGIAAHPDSPKPELAWTDWDAPFDGIEWLSADSEWRDESRLALSRVLFDYFLRPAPALALLLDRPVETLRHWDALSQHRPVVGLAGVDAHGGIGRGIEEGGKRRPALGTIPSYEASFRTFTTRAVLDRPFNGNAAVDARGLMTAIRQGSVFTVIDAIATPAFFAVNKEQGGDSIVRYAIPQNADLIMVRQGRDSAPLQESPAGQYRVRRDQTAAAVRFEVRVPGSPGTPPVPWLVSNPIGGAAPIPEPSSSETGDGVFAPIAAGASWHVEKDPESIARTNGTGGAVRLDYTLASGSRQSQFAAAVTDFAGPPPSFRALVFSVAAARPGRVSVQLRYPSAGGERWAKSVYVDQNRREVRVPIERMLPADFQKGPIPDPSTARSLLFVVDLTNARPGDSNSIAIDDVRLGK
jgi:hypothetical protein